MGLKEQHRWHSLFKGVCLYPKEPYTKIGTNLAQNNPNVTVSFPYTTCIGQHSFLIDYGN